MTKLFFFIALATTLLLSSCVSQKIMQPHWLEKYDAIVCLTYDDGMSTQLTNAIPQLNEFDFAGTFFINNVSSRESMVLWRAASEAGHELANHTLFHPCPTKFGWLKDIATENYTVAQILEEVSAVNAILDLTEKKKRIRSFAYPCNNTIVGSGTSYKEGLAESGLVSYARSGESNQVIISKTNKATDLMNVPSWSVQEGTPLSELQAYVDKTISEKGIGIFQFHGIGGEWLSISAEDHFALLKYLADKKERVAVVTFTQAMVYLEHKK